MEATAKSALSSAVDWYARLLASETVNPHAPAPHVGSDQGGEPKHAGSDRKSAEAAFVRRYVSNRIIDAGKEWYGTKGYVISTR
jgi:hypothetical protein